MFDAYVVPKTAIKCSRVVDRFLLAGAPELPGHLAILDARMALEYAEEFRHAITELCDVEAEAIEEP